MALTPKQQVFVNEYLKHFNATRAAIDAGYSPKTAYNAGWQNVRKCDIAEIISQHISATAMGSDEVLMRLAEHARGDIGEFITVSLSGEVNLDLSGKPNTHLIKKVTQRRTVRTTKDSETDEVVLSVELHDAQAALVQIGRHHKLFTDVTENKTELEITDATDARERIASRIAGIAQRTATSGDTE